MQWSWKCEENFLPFLVRSEETQTGVRVVEESLLAVTFCVSGVLALLAGKSTLLEKEVIRLWVSLVGLQGFLVPRRSENT